MTSVLALRVASALGIANAAPSEDHLAGLFAAWCRCIPFDNLQRLRFIERGGHGPLHGSDPEEFLATWLRLGIGGTCWAVANGLRWLLEELGYEASRAEAAMVPAPSVEVPHGTVVARLAGRLWLLDPSILHWEPLELTSTPTTTRHPLHWITATPEDQGWMVRFRTASRSEPYGCRVGRVDVPAEEYSKHHGKVRTGSPFNSGVIARRSEARRSLEVWKSVRFERTADGVKSDRLSHRELEDCLINEFEVDSAFVRALPLALCEPDVALGRRTAPRLEAS